MLNVVAGRLLGLALTHRGLSSHDRCSGWHHNAIEEFFNLFECQLLEGLGFFVIVVVLGEAATEAHVRILVRRVSEAARTGLLGEAQLGELVGVIFKSQVAHRKMCTIGGELPRLLIPTSQFLSSLGPGLDINYLNILYLCII